MNYNSFIVSTWGAPIIRPAGKSGVDGSSKDGAPEISYIQVAHLLRLLATC